VDEGIWAVRAMAELYGYGLSLHGQEDEPYDLFALSNEDIDRILQ
jgi:hypothetical protein